MTRIAVAFRFTFIVAAAGGGCYLAVDKSSDSPAAHCGQCDDTITASPQPGAGSYSGSLPVDLGTGGGTGEGPRPQDPLPTVPPPSYACGSVPVSRFNELMIIDPQVTNDPRANNNSAYRPWSFRARMESIVPDAPDSAGAVAIAWLGQWSSLTGVPVSSDPQAALISIQPRPAADRVLLCPWLLRSASACDPSCTNCQNRHLDLTVAPFRLLAIVNRIDLAVTGAGAAACGADGGELRFVYGAADPLSSSVMPFTVAFEYAVTLHAGETMRDWAAQWHALGGLTVGSTTFNAKLDGIVAQGLARASLRRVVTNEIAFGGADGLPWEMRQFAPRLTDAGTTRLMEIAVTGTPRLTLAASPELGQWIDTNAMSIVTGQNLLPSSMLSASAPIPTADFAWHTSATDATAAAVFNHNTCNGCHGGRTDPADLRFQHIAPPTTMTYYGSGAGAPVAAHLSLFLNKPNHDDELGRREKLLLGLVCAPCDGTSGEAEARGSSGTRAVMGTAGAGAAAGAAGTGGAPGGMTQTRPAGAAGADGTAGYTGQ